MTKTTAIHNYRKYSAHDAYIIGFIYKHNVYIATMNEIPPRYMKVERESSKKGCREKLQLRLCNAYMEQLIRKGAKYIGLDTLFTTNNKGVEFEKLVSEMNGIEFRGKDSVPFYKAPDLVIDGIGYQLKFNGAQIVTFQTLENLKKGKARG